MKRPGPVKRVLGRMARKFLDLRPVDGGGRGWQIVESFAGAWQQDVRIDVVDVSKNEAVFACQTLIADDMGKFRPRVMQLEEGSGVWIEIVHQVLTPLLRRPNDYQTWQQFVQSWIYSLLRKGNAYILIERDQRTAVAALHVLDPDRCEPLITRSGEVYYRLAGDELAGLTPERQVIVPATELIHDRINCLWHPLVGVSPLWAANLHAQAGQNIGRHVATFFANMARPSGLLLAPGEISDETVARLKAAWQSGFSGTNSGKVAALGDGLQYSALTMDAVDSELLETARLTREQICTAFKVPPFMVGVKDAPAVANSSLLVEQYFRSCLQTLVEGIENTLDIGLDLANDVAIDLDVDSLLRLDQAARYTSYDVAIKGGWLAPNEARKRENMRPVIGGESPMIQQQNYSLAALAKRDAKPDPFATSAPKALPAPTDPNAPDPDGDPNADQKAFTDALRGLLNEA